MESYEPRILNCSPSGCHESCTSAKSNFRTREKVLGAIPIRKAVPFARKDFRQAFLLLKSSAILGVTPAERPVTQGVTPGVTPGAMADGNPGCNPGCNPGFGSWPKSIFRARSARRDFFENSCCPLRSFRGNLPFRSLAIWKTDVSAAVPLLRAGPVMFAQAEHPGRRRANFFTPWAVACRLVVALCVVPRRLRS